MTVSRSELFHSRPDDFYSKEYELTRAEADLKHLNKELEDCIGFKYKLFLIGRIKNVTEYIEVLKVELESEDYK